MNDLFHQMFFSMVSSQVAPRLQVKGQINKEWIPQSKREIMNFEHILQASGNLARKKIGVSLKATKTQIMSTFSDHIFIEIALVGSHGNGLVKTEIRASDKFCLSGLQRYCHLPFCGLYYLSTEWLAWQI